ncbi:hypothetical protein ACRRTK_014615 [Alexandromys fortis]
MDGTSCPSLPQCKRLGNRPERTSLSRPHLWPCEGRPRREKGRRGPPRGKLRSLNQPPGQRPPLEEGRGRYSRREAGRTEQGLSPRAGRLQPAQARLLPARRSPARLAPPPPPARALPPALPGQRAVHARRPGPRSRRTLVRSARRRAAPRVGRRVPPRPLQARRLCLRPALAPPPPHPLGLALLSRRNRGPALRRSSPPPPPNNPRRAPRAQAPPSQRAGPGVPVAVPVGKAALGRALRRSELCVGRTAGAQ